VVTFSGAQKSKKNGEWGKGGVEEIIVNWLTGERESYFSLLLDLVWRWIFARRRLEFE
jgi:hypothetical protein